MKDNILEVLIDQYLSFDYFNNKSQSEKTEIKNRLISEFESELNSNIMSILPDNLIPMYNSLKSDNSPELESFLIKNIPDYEGIVEELSRIFIDELVRSVS